MSSLVEAGKSGDRLDQLLILRDKLANAIDICESMRDLAALSRQYRETLREIEESEARETDENEIEKLLEERQIDGKSGAVREDRSKLHRK
jgi:hypothetical protein